MKTKILPAVWYCTASGVFAGLVIAGKILALPPLIALVAAWTMSIVVALSAGCVLVSMKPELRFSTKTRVIGLGYIHQPLGFIVFMSALTLCCAARVLLGL